MTDKLTGSEKDLLKVYDTQPTGWVGHYSAPTFEPAYGHNFPLFQRSLVPTIRKDPRVRFALNMIKGPIQSFTAFVSDKEAENPQLHETIREQGIQFVYSIKCDDEKISQFILDSYNTFWQNGLQEALLAIDWGFSANQTIFTRNNSDGLIHYDSLDNLHPLDVGPLKKDNKFVGLRLRGVPGVQGGKDLPLWKVFWHTHCKEHHRFWGQSRLEWAFVPWHETWVQYGARDIRRSWFYRNSYDGGSMRYPVGRTKTESGEQIENRDLAVALMSQMRTGGFRIFPAEVGPDGKTPSWEYEPPTSNITPQGLMEYPEVLRLEILEAMGIPPEVVESSSDTGFGGATGRKVPLMIYYASLSPLVNNLVNDFKRYILNNLVQVNFKRKVDFIVSRVIPLKAVAVLPPGSPKPAKEGTPSPKKTDPVTKTSTDGLPA